jgi:hypothetical protein
VTRRQILVTVGNVFERSHSRSISGCSPFNFLRVEGSCAARRRRIQNRLLAGNQSSIAIPRLAARERPDEERGFWPALLVMVPAHRKVIRDPSPSLCPS